jgi:repressor LexA
MGKLSKKQDAVRLFIAPELTARRHCRTHRDTGSDRYLTTACTASGHLDGSVETGILNSEPGPARALCQWETMSRTLETEVPFFGSIPAGFGDDRDQESEGCISVDIALIGFKPTRNTFALRVVGDSMIGRHICEGDIVILEHGSEPRHGQIVAALIDRKSTLKTFMQKGAKRFLKAENPKYPDLIPSEELMIQGVFRGLIRKA